MKRREIPRGLLASILGVTVAGNKVSAQPPTMERYPRTPAEVAAGVVPISDTFPPLSVLRYGADPSGVSDSAPAFQSLADVIAHTQRGQLRVGRIHTAVASIPEGFFTLKDRVRWHGPIAITGAGTAGWEGGTTIVQAAPGRNIFEFYGSLDDQTTLGLSVRGISFGFSPGASGCALYVPKYSDTAHDNVLSSNSLYVEDCRFGGFSPYGSFLRVHHGNDIVLSRCLFDGCYADAILLGDDTDASGRCTDVCIESCGFFNTDFGIRVANAEGVVISGCRFFHGSPKQEMIRLGGKATATAARVENVVICANIFDDIHHAITLDGSVSQVQISGNGFYACHDRPLRLLGRTDVSGLQLGSNVFKVDAAYGFSALLDASDCLIVDSIVCDNLINCNGVRSLTQLAAEVSGRGRWGAGVSLRDNVFINNPAYPFAGSYDYKPCTARGLELENQLAFSGYPVAQPVFHLDELQVGQSLMFDLDWEVIVTAGSASTAGRIGRDRVSAVCWRAGGTVNADVTRVSSVGDHSKGADEHIADVRFALATGPRTDVVVTISGALKSPQSVRVNIKASNFKAGAAAGGRLPQIKNAIVG